MTSDETILEPVKHTPVVGEWDVLIVGGGPAGIAAAVGSARNGARTMLVERYGFLGGMLTAGLVNCINGFRNQRGSTGQVVAGIGEEMVKKMASAGGAYLPPGPLPYCVVVDPEVAKHVAMQMVLESGASMLLHCLATNALKQAGAVSGIIVHSKSGRRALRAKVIVDCTGDGDVAANAGEVYRSGRESDGKRLPLQLMLAVGSVDATSLAAYASRNRDRLRATYDIEPLETVEAAADAGRPFGVAGLSLGEMGNVSCVVWKERALLWAGPSFDMDGTSVEHLTAAEMNSRTQALGIAEALKRIPGFEHSRLEQTGTQIGVRETRRIVGEYILTERDVVEGSTFDDSVAVGINPMACLGKRPILTHNGYEIPYRCLLPESINGIILAGRCISTSHEAHGSIRAMATCMATGQAAGTGAALSALTGEIPRHLSIPRLQELLQSQGAVTKRPC